MKTASNGTSLESSGPTFRSGKGHWGAAVKRYFFPPFLVASVISLRSSRAKGTMFDNGFSLSKSKPSTTELPNFLLAAGAPGGPNAAQSSWAFWMASASEANPDP